MRTVRLGARKARVLGALEGVERDRDRRLSRKLALTTRFDTLVQDLYELETFPPLPTDRNHPLHGRTRPRVLVV
ncbi:MAG: hypothetical protein R3C05_18955 [Pirellulaceae bacterium]